MTAIEHVPTHRWRAFAVLAVSFFMTIVDLTIVNVALPTIGRKLHFNESNLQWVVTAYGLTFGGFLLLGGRAADLLGRRRILMVGLSVFTAASLACALATTDSFLIVMRGVQGLGAAIVLPAALSIVMNMFPEGAERNKALGVWGGIGAERRDRRADRRRPADPIRSAGSTSSSSTSRSAPPRCCSPRASSPRAGWSRRAAATTRSARSPSPAGCCCSSTRCQRRRATVGPRARTITLLAAAGALIVAFLVIETRVEEPLMPLRIFRLKTVAGANAVGLLLGGSFFAFIFIGTLYMQQVLGYSAIKTGLAWLAASLTSVAFAGLSQALVGKVSAKLVMAFGMALIGGGILWSTPSRCTATSGPTSPGRSSSPGRAPHSPSSPCPSPDLPASPSTRRASRPGCSTPRSRSAARSGSPWRPPSPRRASRRSPTPGHGPRRPHRRVPVGAVGLRGDRARRRPGDLPARAQPRPRIGRVPAEATLPSTRPRGRRLEMGHET